MIRSSSGSGSGSGSGGASAAARGGKGKGKAKAKAASSSAAASSASAAALPDGHASLPLFLPTLRVAPYLSAVLRRLLARGEAAEARRVLLAALSMPEPEEDEDEDFDGNVLDPKARRLQRRLTRKKLKLRQHPSHACVMRTAHALEWLLFTALEAACEEGEGEGEGEGKEEGKEEEEEQNDENKTVPSSSLSPSLRLLSEVASLLTHHPLARDVVVSVARKTDASMWPRLFAAAGRPSLLASAAISDRSLDAAAACLLLVDRVEGSDAAHALAIRLLAAVLAPAFLIVGGGGGRRRGRRRRKRKRRGRRRRRKRKGSFDFRRCPLRPRGARGGAAEVHHPPGPGRQPPSPGGVGEGGERE